MTVTYTHEVANARLGGFSNLLLRWRGSVYKLFYKEFAIYITLYTILSICYRHIVIPDFRDYFEKLCLQFQSYTDLVPISFVLGFYVSMVVGRWWQMYLYIPWPDRLMVIVTANVHGSDNRGRLIRRTLMRYLSLAQVLTYRSISTAVYKRFPTIQHVIDAGFMTSSEHKQYENVKTQNAKYFLPCVWFSNLLSKVRQERRIYDDMTYQTILKELNDFRGCCGMLFSYDWISIPLVYTQVVTVAVYVFFLSTLLSRQYLDVQKNYPGHEVDLYVPIFTICQFFFYVGWLKVAEQLINPFGEDDDDFEMNFIIDRNLELSMLTVDNLYLSHPKLERDMYWNNPNPSIPYTAAAANHKLEAFVGSTIDMSLHRDEMQFLDQTQNPLESLRNRYLDINQNYTVSEKQRAAQYSQSPLYPSTKPSPPRLSNPVNFWRRFTGRDKESEMKKALLQKDFLPGRSNAGTQNNIMVEERDDDEEKYSLTLAQDDDSSDSDVGDGGGSEDDESDGNKSSRRSSISSLDGDEDDTKEEGVARKSSIERKHSIAEPEDRPKAKKRKNNLPSSQAISDPLSDKTRMKTSEKPKRLDIFPQTQNEGTSKNVPARFLLSKGKKSPKKKNNLPKLNKRNDFQRHGEETEEERKNAQTRTIGLLKASKRKSTQALQRNARRMHYPGNAWLRHKYPYPWRSDVMSAGDYASMTSGNEDQGKTEHDSPFGSMISFATSIPSPRPLRFSHFGKCGKRRHFDSVSNSSCLTSPCANEDFSPSTGFLNASPKDQNPSNSISMPFTEDLRRRLLVAKTANTPSSSTATSPILGRAVSNSVGYYQTPSVFQQTSENGQDSDDLLIIASTARSTSGTAWENTLEAIGEAAPADKVTSTQRQNQLASKEEKTKVPSSPNYCTLHQNAVSASDETQTTQDNKSRNLQVPPHRLLSRSSSCPDVPASRLVELSYGKVQSPVKKFIAPVGAFQVESQGNIDVDLEAFSSKSHHANEVRQASSNSASDGPKEVSCVAARYPELTRYCSSEVAPLLPQVDVDEGERADIPQILLPRNDSRPCCNENTSLEKLVEHAPRKGADCGVCFTSDLGYCSAKEDAENGLISDPLAKLGLLQITPLKESSVRGQSDRLSNISEEEILTTTNLITVLEDKAQQEDRIPDAVAIPISPSDDVVIDIP